MVVIVDLADRPRFFVGAAVGLTIGEAVLTGKEIAISLSRLFLW